MVHKGSVEEVVLSVSPSLRSCASSNVHDRLRPPSGGRTATELRAITAGRVGNYAAWRAQLGTSGRFDVDRGRRDRGRAHRCGVSADEPDAVVVEADTLLPRSRARSRSGTRRPCSSSCVLITRPPAQSPVASERGVSGPVMAGLLRAHVATKSVRRRPADGEPRARVPAQRPQLRVPQRVMGSLLTANA